MVTNHSNGMNDMMLFPWPLLFVTGNQRFCHSLQGFHSLLPPIFQVRSFGNLHQPSDGNRF
jgi:hypothetical protein